MTRYPEDEFDAAARSRGPKGAHRPAEPIWRKLLPILAAVILGPLLAWGFISALNRNAETGSGTASEAPSVVETTEGTTTDAGGTPGTDPTDAANPDEEATEPGTTEPEATDPAAAVSFDAPVAVLNGAQVQGIAGRTAERLQEAGFTDTSASDYLSGQPETSTIYYNNPELADTAAFIGELLGIADATELASATDSIAVVLRSDFQE